MAEETAELTLEQELESLFGDPAPAGAPAGTKTEPGAQQPAATSPPAVNLGEENKETPPETPTEEDPLQKALDSIEDGEEKPKEGEPAKPQLTEEQSYVLQQIPNRDTAKALVETAQNFGNFAGAFQQGRFDDVMQMFEQWDKSAFENFMEHIYTKKVDSEEWVNRFIQEREGGKQNNTQVRNLQRQLDEVKNQLNQRSQSETQSAQVQRDRQTFEAYQKHLDGLFTKIGATEEDRSWIEAKIKAALQSDSKTFARLKSGDVTAVNKIFKETSRAYYGHTRKTAAAVETKIEAQDKHKAPVGSAPTQAQHDALPDDINQVPADKRDTWMDQQLGKLSKLLKR